MKKEIQQALSSLQNQIDLLCENVSNLHERCDTIESTHNTHKLQHGDMLPNGAVYEKPQPIEGVEFEAHHNGGHVFGIRKSDKSLFWGDGWEIAAKDDDSTPCHLVPVEKYTVGRVYKWEGLRGDNPEYYFLCTGVNKEGVCDTIGWIDGECRPIEIDFSLPNNILEVRPIQ